MRSKLKGGTDTEDGWTIVIDKPVDGRRVDSPQAAKIDCLREYLSVNTPAANAPSSDPSSNAAAVCNHQ